MRLTTVLWVLSLSVALTGCALWTEQPVAVEIQTVRIAPPESLLSCADRPAVPPAPLTESAVMQYVARLRAAHQDCQGKLGEIRRLYNEAPTP